MRKKHRVVFLVTFSLATLAVGLLSAALGTDFWVLARPIRLVDESTKGQARNVTGGDLSTKFQGLVHFGLFRGQKELDHGLGLRKEEITVTIQANDRELFNFALWVSSIVFLALGIVLGITSMTFAIINASTRPVETVTGPLGLYVWNSLAALFSCLSFVLYLVLFFTDFRKNVLIAEDREVFKWTSEGRASLHYSFYLVVVATLFFLANILVLALSRLELRSIKYKGDKALEGVMMY